MGKAAEERLPIPLINIGEWTQHARCYKQDYDADLFFHSQDVKGGSQTAKQRADEAKALAMCAACPVKRECKAHAFKNREGYGIWGGETQRARRARIAKLLNRVGHWRP